MALKLKLRIRRSSNGLIFNLHTDPQVEDIFRSLSTGQRPAKMFGRDWAPFPEEPLDVYIIPPKIHSRLLALFEGNKHSVNFDIGQSLLAETGFEDDDPDSPPPLGGRRRNQAPSVEVNLSPLFLVGTSRPDGVRFRYTSLASQAMLNVFCNSWHRAATELLSKLWYPVDICLKISSAESQPTGENDGTSIPF